MNAHATSRDLKRTARLEEDAALLRAVVGAQLETGLLAEILEFLAAEHGVEALDGADGDAADIVELVRLEVLDVVDLSELPAGVGRYELVELTRGLLA